MDSTKYTISTEPHENEGDEYLSDSEVHSDTSLEILMSPYDSQNSSYAYYSPLWDAYIVDYYKDESFPLFGWIKPCIYCDSITKEHIIFNYKKRHRRKKKKALYFPTIIPICEACMVDINELTKREYQEEFTDFLNEFRYQKNCDP